MKILVATRHERMQELIQKRFRQEGVLVEWTDNWRGVLQKLAAHDYSGIVLDMELSTSSSPSWVHHLRDHQPHAALICVDGDATSEQRIACLRAGADDFQDKPFSIPELIARFQAIWRRPVREEEEEIHLGPLRLNPDSRVVLVDDERLELTGKEFEILFYLLRHRHRVVSKDTLIDFIWSDDVGAEFSYDFLYAHLKNLRRKLAAAGLPGIIKTVYGIGYQVEGDLL